MDERKNSDSQVSRYMASRRDKNNEETAGTSQAVDESHKYKITRKFVRIEYPGLVKNVSKAIETLGGIYNIETVIADPKRRLDLRFHPDNRYNKPCYADRDNSPGLLIKVFEKDGQFTYNIIGYTTDNFKFNKAADFQYLPLVQDNETGDVEYVHSKIFPGKLPNLDFLISKESVSQPVLLLPLSFGRLEATHHTLYLRADEKYNLNTNARPEMFRMFNRRPNKKKSQYRQISSILNMNDPNLEIPQGPSEAASKIIKEKFLEDRLKLVKKLFQDRPIWTRAAVLHKTGITKESVKYILPNAAYYWLSGPWRSTWTRFGFDPRQDFSSRIYQTLDYRIRTKEGTKLKIQAKRKYGLDSYTQEVINIMSNDVNESHYILSPDVMPPARQMFYQYCNIKIPEVQDMLQRLPKTPINQKCDIKTGWLPTNFPEQCREIVNRYVIQRVHRELLEDSIKSQSKHRNSAEDEEQSDKENPSSLLDMMKKGFARKLDPRTDAVGGTVILSDDDTSDDMEDVVNSIPATIEDNSDVDDLSDDSEMELDMEAVEEINQLIFDTKLGAGDQK